MDIGAPATRVRSAIVLVVLVAVVGIGYAAWPSGPAAPAAAQATGSAGATPTRPATPSPQPATPSPQPGASGPLTGTGSDEGTGTLHYISNTGPNVRPVAALGYNLFDLGPTDAYINRLGPGQRALVWLGNLDNTSCTPGYSWSEFTAKVRSLARNPKVFGYYISDEPHPSICPHAAADIRARADYIHRQNPEQKVFIVVMDASRLCGSAMGCEYRAMRPEVTHVDLYGLDPFPCRIGGPCQVSKINTEVQRAVAAGIPVDQIVPVIQAFGQNCTTRGTKYYAEPSAADLTQMLARWNALVPRPAFDFTYTWRSEGPACPGLDKATGSTAPNLQAVMRTHNAG